MRDWRKADRLERIYMYLLQPDYFDRFFSRSDREYLALLQRAYSIISTNISTRETVYMLRSVHPEIKSDERAMKIIRDVKKIWGNLVKSNKEFDRMVIREKLLQIAKLCEDADDWELQLKALNTIIKMDGLDKHDQSQFDPAEFELPAITFTDDPSALEEGGADEEE